MRRTNRTFDRHIGNFLNTRPRFSMSVTTKFSVLSGRNDVDVGPMSVIDPVYRTVSRGVSRTNQISGLPLPTP